MSQSERAKNWKEGHKTNHPIHADPDLSEIPVHTYIHTVE